MGLILFWAYESNYTLKIINGDCVKQLVWNYFNLANNLSTEYIIVLNI